MFARQQYFAEHPTIAAGTWAGDVPLVPRRCLRCYLRTLHESGTGGGEGERGAVVPLALRDDKRWVLKPKSG